MSGILPFSPVTEPCVCPACRGSKRDEDRFCTECVIHVRAERIRRHEAEKELAELARKSRRERYFKARGYHLCD